MAPASQGSIENSNKITLLVFKDNYPARTFQIPLSWISRFGILVGILFTLSIVSSLIAIKQYRLIGKTDPARVQDLEQELSELKIRFRSLDIRPLAKDATKSVAIQLEKAEKAEKTEKASAAAATAAEKAQARASENSALSSASILTSGSAGNSSDHASRSFSTFPQNLQDTVPDPATLPITILSPRADWKGSTLKVRFALQYVKNDQGTQQGRILIFARGLQQLLAYPSGSFNPTGVSNLIAPERGEPFSVSRYREVKADFWVGTTQSLRDIEILIFNKENQLIIYQKIQVSSDQPSKASRNSGNSGKSDTEEKSDSDSAPLDKSEETEVKEKPSQSAPVTSPQSPSSSSGSSSGDTTPAGVPVTNTSGKGEQ